MKLINLHMNLISCIRFQLNVEKKLVILQNACLGLSNSLKLSEQTSNDEPDNTI